ncbi:unnamed protein product [Paramecium sonneborni]|uniref:Uncharacterized protein n=1 Tax=Paramecium sonneborni TaxID=65129 RepID=A0A8S1K7A7_9CILI|nr:unnamed protein product [Paramecium sonneborni]
MNQLRNQRGTTEDEVYIDPERGIAINSRQMTTEQHFKYYKSSFSTLRPDLTEFEYEAFAKRLRIESINPLMVNLECVPLQQHQEWLISLEQVKLLQLKILMENLNQIFKFLSCYHCLQKQNNKCYIEEDDFYYVQKQNRSIFIDLDFL